MAIKVEGGLYWDATLNGQQFKTELDNIRRKMDILTGKIEDDGKQMEAVFQRLGVGVASFFSVQAAQNFVQKLVSVRGEFEQLQVSFETILKSKDKADKLFAETVNTAATTPFNLTEVAQSTKQLLAYGTQAKDITKTITMLGNIASGVSAPLSDIVYLYGTLQTQGRAYSQDIRQFTGRGIPIIQELAKQFNVTDSQVNKLVEDGKVGFPEIQKAFESLTGSSGIFYNLMEKQSLTLTGQLSNLEDAFDQMLNTIGEQNENVLTGAIEITSDLVKNYQDVIDIVERIIILYGSYRAALLLAAAAERIVQEAQLQAALAQKEIAGANIVLEGSYALLRQGIVGATAAIENFFAVTKLNNPYVLLAVAIGTAVAATVDFKSQTNYAAKASADYTSQLAQEKSKLDELFGKLEATKAGTKERADAVKNVTDAYKEYLPKMDLEKASLKDLEGAYDQVNQRLSDNIALKAKLTQQKSLETDFGKEIEDQVTSITEAVEHAAGALQSGKASVTLAKLLKQAQDGSLLLGPGDRTGAGGQAAQQKNFNFAKQLLGNMDVSDGDVRTVEMALNRLQKVIDIQRKSRKLLNDFYKGTQTEAPEVKQEDSPAVKAAKQFAEDLKDPLKNFDKLVKEASNKEQVTELQKALQDKLDALAPNDKQQDVIKKRLEAVQKLLDTYSIKAQQKSAETAEAAAQRYADIINKVFQTQARYSAALLTDDQEKLQTIRNDFNQLRADIDKYNANPKNVKKVNKAIVNRSEDDAIDNQADLNENKYIAEDLDKKKQLYQEYYEFRIKVGSELADSEYSDLLESGKSFETFIKNLQNSLPASEKDLSPAAFDERKKLFKKYADEIKQTNSKLNLDIVAQTLDFNQQNNLILKNGIDLANGLLTAGKKKEAMIILNQAQDEIDQRVLSQRETIQSYEELYANIANLTKSQADLQITDAKAKAKADFDNGKISEDAYKRLIELIKQAEGAIKSNTITNGLAEVATALQSIANVASEVNQGFGSVVSTIASTIGQVAQLGKDIGNLKNQIQNFQQNKQAAGGGFLGTVSTVTNMIPIIGSVISGVIGTVGKVINFFKAAKESAIQAAKEMQTYQNSLITGEIEYNELLRERAATIKDINDLTIQQLETQQKLLQTQTQQAQSDYNKLLSLIQTQGQQITGEHTEKYGGILGIGKKTKVVQDLAGLGSVDYDQLEKLYTDGKLADSTKAWFEQLKKVHDEMGDITDETKQVQDQIDQIFTGTTANNLEDAILTGLKAGKRGISDFADDFNSTMQDAISSIFEKNYLQGKAQAFYDEFASLSESGGGLTSDEIAKLHTDYNSLITGASTMFDKLYQVTGIKSPTSDTTGTSTSSLQGSIKGITADQANVLEGTFRGVLLNTAQMSETSSDIRDKIIAQTAINQQIWDQIQQNFLYLTKIEANTKKSADNSDYMRDSLKNIDKNTSDSTGAILRAAGITKI